jgi:hypothetical protein
MVTIIFDLVPTSCETTPPPKGSSVGTAPPPGRVLPYSDEPGSSPNNELVSSTISE